MNKLYVLQYYNNDVCSPPYSGEIFTSRKKAYEYIKNNNLNDLRYVSVYEYDDDIGGYQELTHLYYIDKTDYPKNARNVYGYL